MTSAGRASRAVLALAVTAFLVSGAATARSGRTSTVARDDVMALPSDAATLLKAAGIPGAPEPPRSWLVLLRTLHGRFPGPLPPAIVALAATPPAASSEESVVPRLLPHALWEQAVFRRAVDKSQLAAAILQDRSAALLYIGLFSLDRETLAYFVSHPSVLSSIYKQSAGVFAAFSERLTVREGRVVLPGDASVIQEWQRLTGASAGEPERFIPALLAHDAGRLAWLLDTVCSLDAPHMRFSLREGLERLYGAFSSETLPVDFAGRSFVRPPLDAGVVLRTVSVTEEGLLAPPRDLRLWESVFHGSAPWTASGASRQEVTAAWLLKSFGAIGTPVRRARLDAVTFAQRVFASTTDENVTLSLLGHPRHSALMLTLEHLDFHDPLEYVNALRVADAASGGIDKSRAESRVAILQGCLALVVRLREVGTIDGRTARNLVLSLLKIQPGERYAASVARWIEGELMPPSGDEPRGSSATPEERLLNALAGVRESTSLPVIEWEEHSYRVDIAAGELARLRRIRHRQGGRDLTAVLSRRGGVQEAELAQVLASCAYAIAIGDPDSALLMAGDPARVHDLDVGGPSAWQVAQSVRAGSQLVMRGSLLGLDRALAFYSLRQPSLDAPTVAPNIEESDVQGIAESAAVINPFRLDDRDRDDIARDVRLGRERVVAAVADSEALEGLARRAGIERWRSRLMREAVASGATAVLDYWSLGELYAVGHTGEPGETISGWGVAQRPLDGSWRETLPFRLAMHDVAGRIGMGMMSAYLPDLHLRVALWLAEKKLPAALAPGVLRSAAWDLTTSVQASDLFDWLAAARAAQSVSSDRLADYVSALTADGPLVPTDEGTTAAVDATGARTAGPSVRLLEPANGSYVTGETLIRATVQPPGQAVERMAFFVDGRLVCTVKQPPFECAWNGGTSVRPHLFRVKAYLPGGAQIVQIARTKGDEYVDSGGVDVVHVTASVLDGDRFVSDLPREAFRVFEDGKEQKISYFASESSHLELVIGIDVSASMDRAIENVKQNVSSFMSALRPEDSLTLVLFNHNFFVLTRPSVDLNGRLKTLERVATWGATSLHEAMVKSFDLLGKQARRRGLVMFTDGDDTSSRVPASFVERRAETSDAVVYMIGQGRAVQSPGLKQLCNRLATSSGGRAFFPREEAELRAAFDAIREEMSHQYLLSYVPPSATRDGAFHRITVEVKGGLEVRARQGYRFSAR